jgi:hypothetical protein
MKRTLSLSREANSFHKINMLSIAKTNVLPILSALFLHCGIRIVNDIRFNFDMSAAILFLLRGRLSIPFAIYISECRDAR